MAEAMKFTQKTLTDLKPREATYEVREAGATGLRLRVSPTGVKSFRWVLRSRNRVKTLGRFGDGSGGTITVQDARSLMGEARDLHDAGLDPCLPGSAEGAGVDEDERPTTVAQLCDLFYRREIQPSRKRPEVVADIIKRDIKPTIGSLRLIAVDTITAGRPARAAVARGAKVHASKVLQVVKQMFGFAAETGIVKISPAATLSPRRLDAKMSRKGARWLRAEEVAEFCRALDRSKMDPATKCGLRLLLLTGLRSNEARTLKWDDIDFKAKTLTVRAENRKMSPEKADEAGDWVQPLSEQAVAVLEKLQEVAPEEVEWVFHSEDAKTGTLTDKAMGRAMKRLWSVDRPLKALLDQMVERAAKEADLRDIKLKPRASPHDLRRTVATHLRKTLKVSRETSQLVLDHSLNRILGSGVADTYDKESSLDERRDALDKLGAWVDGLVSPKAPPTAANEDAGLAKVIRLAQ